MDEAEIVTTQHGDVPLGQGWYVLNAQRAPLQHSPGFGGSDLSFQGDAGSPRWASTSACSSPGAVLHVPPRGPPRRASSSSSGCCLAIVEGHERTLEAWDFLHSPGGTEHVLVGAGDGPCVIVAFGARRQDDGTLYVASQVAASYCVSVAADTPDPSVAYADAPPFVDGPAPPLPGF